MDENQDLQTKLDQANAEIFQLKSRLQKGSEDLQPGPAGQAAPTESTGTGPLPTSTGDEVIDARARADVKELKLEFDRYKEQLHDAGIRLVS